MGVIMVKESVSHCWTSAQRDQQKRQSFLLSVVAKKQGKCPFYWLCKLENAAKPLCRLVWYTHVYHGYTWYTACITAQDGQWMERGCEYQFFSVGIVFWLFDVTLSQLLNLWGHDPTCVANQSQLISLHTLFPDKHSCWYAIDHCSIKGGRVWACM